MAIHLDSARVRETTQLAAVVANLNLAISSHWENCGRAERCSDDKSPIWELFRDADECEALLEDLYLAAETATATASAIMNTTAQDARRFRKRVIGNAPHLSRTKILATALRMGLEMFLHIWSSFLASLDFQDFDDYHLPGYTLEDLEGLLGGREVAAAFRRHQHHFCGVDTDNHFVDVSKQLKDLLNKQSHDQSVETVVVCERLTIEGEVDCDEYEEDRWYPEALPIKLVNDHADLVQSLLVEAYKIVHRIQDATDAHERRRMMTEAKSHARSVYEGLRPRARVLAILLSINVTASSIAWKKFVRHCIEDPSPLPSTQTTLHDALLPMDMASIKKHLGDDDIWLFYSGQYSFCTVTLEKERQIDWLHHKLHLPLRRRQVIGSGSFGVVSRVTVKAGYFKGHADEELAMKVMEKTPSNYGEWGSAEWLFRQPITHEGIMKAVASVKTHTHIYIFFPLATCSLSQFMSGPLGNSASYHPRNCEDRQKALGYFADVAEALRYLHCGMQENSRRAKMVLIHEDLKTDNILVLIDADSTPTRIRFQITDFGISSVKRFQQNSKQVETVNRNQMFLNRHSLRGIPTNPGVRDNCPNFPPEARGGGDVDASIDVYAFGLVLAEGLAWIAGGPEELSSLGRARHDSKQPQSPHLSHEIDPETGKPRLKESIRVWFEKLLEKPRDPLDHRLLRDCWDLVQHGLLACIPEERPLIEDVCEILGRIYRREVIDVRALLNQAHSKRFIGENTVLARVRRSLPESSLAVRRDSDAPSVRSNTTSVLSQSEHRESSDSDPISLVDSYTSTRARPSRTEAPSPNKNILSRWAKLRRVTTALPSPSSQQRQEESIDRNVIRTTPEVPRPGIQSIHRQIRENDFEAAKHWISNGGLSAEEITSACEDKTLLEVALEKRDDGLLAAVINRCVALSVQDQPPFILHTVAKHNMVDSARGLLEGHLVNIDAEDRSGLTALSVAFDHRNAAVAAVLLEYEASTHCLGHETALHRAVMCTESDAVEQILSKNAAIGSIDQENGEGRTALQQAAKAGTVKNANILLLNKADPNRKDRAGRTALFWAMGRSKNDEMVKLLLDHKADPRKVTKARYRKDYQSLMEKCSLHSV